MGVRCLAVFGTSCVLTLALWVAEAIQSSALVLGLMVWYGCWLIVFVTLSAVASAIVLNTTSEHPDPPDYTLGIFVAWGGSVAVLLAWLTSAPGLVSIGGTGLCLVGYAVTALARRRQEREERSR